MATSVVSLGTSLAPTDFKVCASFEDSNGAISVAVERCQLCGGNRRTFYCKECAQSGKFTHSKTRHSPERYEDKVNKWNMLKKERLKLLKRIEKAMVKKEEGQAKKSDVDLAKERVLLMKKSVAEMVEKLNQDKEELRLTREKNESRRTKYVRHEEKKRRIRKYIEKALEYTAKQQSHLDRSRISAGNLRRQHIKDLLEYIFPLEEIKPKTVETDAMAMSTVSALAEARQTSYIRGRWVYTENAGELQYRIVEPTLPGNGDYSAYNLWLLEHKETSVQGSELNQRNPAYTISAGLSYTIHLVTLLAHFLDVNLPRRLCFSELCGTELSEGQFARSVNALNHNVLHLCFTQRVNPEELNPKHTVQNIILLLKARDLGRCGSFSVNPELMQSLEEARLAAAQEGTETDLSSDDDSVDGAGCDPDWEEVPTSLPEAEVPSPPTYDSHMVSTQSGSRLDPAAAGGLMSSAAASVASFWRAATGRPN